MSSAANVVVVDDTPCAADFCYGPLGAWNAAMQQGTIVPIRTVPLDPLRGYSIGTYSHGAPSAAPTVAPTTPMPMAATAAPTVPPAAPYTGPVFKEGVDVMDFVVKRVPNVKWDKYAANLGAGDGVAMIPGVSCEAGFDCTNQWSDPVYPLFMHRGFHGLCVEGNPSYLPLIEKHLPKPDIKKVTAMINPMNVVQLLKDGNAPIDMDYFKNDIDSYDCAVHLAVLDAGYRPKVIQVEVNPDIPYPINFGVLYSQDYKPNLGAAGFYGCSLTLTSTIMRPFGYVLAEVGMGHDAVYVRKDIADAAGIPGMSDQQGSDKLGKCCLTGHFGTLGSYAVWNVLPVPAREQAVQMAALQGCVMSQGTPTCMVPYTTIATDFLSLARASIAAR